MISTTLGSNEFSDRFRAPRRLMMWKLDEVWSDELPEPLNIGCDNELLKMVCSPWALHNTLYLDSNVAGFLNTKAC